MSTDTDLQPVSVACRTVAAKSEPKHRECAPAVYVSPLVWDGVDNSVFRPLSDALSLRAPAESVNVNSLDEVPDSSWFTNRIGAGVGIDELSRGACRPEQLLADAEDAPDGSWVIDKGKDNGSSPGFRVRIPGKGKFMLKSDAPVAERPSAASVIGAAAYHAFGFNVSCEQVVYVRPTVFTLTPGLTVTDNTERTYPFDAAALQRVLDGATKRGGYLRFQASAWLEGRLIGPFRYEGTRDDDPNDTVPHEDRRELRGGRLLAAWIDHFDAREQNSMDVWLATRPSAGTDSSPGIVKHYYLDTSDALGSEWQWDGISRRLGHSYLLDWGYISADFVTLGIPSRPWDRAARTPGFEKFGYFSARDFVPEDWVNEYPNPAFSPMTERDGAWAARILAGFTPAVLRTIVEMGRFSAERDTRYIEAILGARLRNILERYLTRLSPLAAVHVEGGERLCAEDRAELRGLRAPDAFRYRARLGTRWLDVDRPSAGHVCASLPHVARDDGPPDDSPVRYVSVTIDDGVARGGLVAHLYDLGPSRGYRLAGLER